jgi:hypothetical protein
MELCFYIWYKYKVGPVTPEQSFRFNAIGTNDPLSELQPLADRHVLTLLGG